MLWGMACSCFSNAAAGQARYGWGFGFCREETSQAVSVSWEEEDSEAKISHKTLLKESDDSCDDSYDTSCCIRMSTQFSLLVNI